MKIKSNHWSNFICKVDNN